MENLGNTLPGSESFIEAEQGSDNKKGAGNKNCLNCGAELKGLYCHECGQKDIPRRQGIGDLLVNFIGSFTSFESKFFRSLKTLLFKPGKIILEYNDGKRETYFHPARMYVFLSFVFFLLIALIPDEDLLTMKTNGRELSSEEKRALLDSGDLNWGQEAWTFGVPKTFAEYDSIENAKPADERDGKLGQYFTRKLILLQQRSGKDPRGFWLGYWQKLKDNIPKVIFILLPFFALILKLLYIRRDFYYAEHLVFSIYFYDFMYLVGIVWIGAGIFNLDWFQLLLWLTIYFYLYKAMRKVYKQPRFKTIVKFLLLNVAFFFCILTAFIINAIVTLILL